MKRIMTFFLLVLFLILAGSIASADETTLSVCLYGMQCMPDGEWLAESIAGRFAVYQNGENLGILMTENLDSQRMNLGDGSEVTLIPIGDSIDPYYFVEPEGYSLAITENMDNTAHLLAYAREGLVTILTDGAHELILTHKEDGHPKSGESFTVYTDTDGKFTTESPVPSGLYLLESSENPLFQQEVEIQPYRGNPQDMTVIDLRGMNIIENASEDHEEESTVTAEDERIHVGIHVPMLAAMQHSDLNANLQIVSGKDENNVLSFPLNEDFETEVLASAGELQITLELPQDVYVTAFQGNSVQDFNRVFTASTELNTDTEITISLGCWFSVSGDVAVDSAFNAVLENAGSQLEMIFREKAYMFNQLEAGSYQLTLYLAGDGWNGEGWECTYLEGEERSCCVTGFEIDGSEQNVVLPEISQSLSASDAGSETVDLTASEVLPENGITVNPENSSSTVVQDEEPDNEMEVSETASDTDHDPTQDADVLDHHDTSALISDNSAEESQNTEEEEIFAVQEGASFLMLTDPETTVNQETDAETGDAHAESDAAVDSESLLNPEESQDSEMPVNQETDAGTSDVHVESDAAVDSESLPNPEESQDSEMPVNQETDAGTGDVHVESDVAVDSESLLSPDREMSYIPLRVLPYNEVHGTAALTVKVFSDTNHNGERGKYEMPLSGAVIDLIFTTETEDTVIASQTTGEDGQVQFHDLPEGDYIVRSQLPSYYGYGEKGKKAFDVDSSGMKRQSAQNQESDKFHLAADANAEFGIGATPAAGISGQAWVDENADGIRQEDEPGQPGILVEMIGLKNGLVYQVVTGDDGFYNFTQLRLGNYKLRVTLPSGMMFTKYSKTGGVNRSIFTDEGKTVAAKQYDMNKAHAEDEQNIGVYGEAGIAGKAFLDANYSGIWDEGDLPLPGVKIIVYRQSTNVELATVVSDSEGNYMIPALRPAAYRIRAILPEGDIFFTRVVNETGGNRFKRQVGRRESSLENVMLSLDEVRQISIGAVQPTTISGVVYMDHNFNGIMENGEEGVAGITVSLLDQNGDATDAVRTGKDGKYAFEEVVPGTHYLSMQAIDGYAFTRLASDNCMVSRGDGYGSTEAFTVSMNTPVTGMNAGLVRPGKVTGTVFADLNDNGSMDEGENGLVGAHIQLTAEDGYAYDVSITGSSQFVMDAVLPGVYKATVAIPEGALFTQTSDWTIQGNIAISAPFEFHSGDERVLSALGGITLGSISGLVFENPEADGVWQTNSSAMEGTTIRLVPDGAKGETLEIRTDASGEFRFDNLRPGTYQLTLQMPDGYVLSRLSEATLPLKNCESEQTVSLTVPMGSSWEEQHLGAVIPGSLEGFIWLDANQSGSYEEEEDIKAVGEEIHVISMDDDYELLTLVTDSNGMFSTDGMIPGKYRLEYHLDSTTMTSGYASDFSEEDGKLIMQPVQIQSNEITDNLELGLIRLTSISGNVWLDQQGTIVPLNGASVTLTDIASGLRVEDMTTLEDGRYSFAGLLPGVYQLSVVLPEGQIVAEASDERLTRNGLVSVMTNCHGRSGESDVFKLIMGSDQENMNIGAVLPGNLGDYVWVDENRNGLMDTSESGLAGIVLHLYRNGVEVATTVTDTYGYYRFNGLYPAMYTIQADLPAEVYPTIVRAEYAGISSILGENGFTEEIQVVSNANNDTADLGVQLQQDGIYPKGMNEGVTQDWSGHTEPGWS